MADRNARMPYIMKHEERKLGTKQERKEFFIYSIILHVPRAFLLTVSLLSASLCHL
jgi:hypothetical protein